MAGIAVYMGSFNPFHKGHLSVTRYLLDQAGFDMVYIIVSPQNPFKDKSLSDNGEMRLRHVVEAIGHSGFENKVKVDDIEFRMPQPSWSIRTLDALKAREPQNDFTLVVGGDNLHELPDWREGARILEEYGVAVYPRSGFDMKADVKKLEKRLSGCKMKVRLLENAPLVNISSTEIRKMQSEGFDVSHLVI